MFKKVTIENKKRKVPFYNPMRPKPTTIPIRGPQWIVEMKKDGSLTYLYSYNNNLGYLNRRGVDKTAIYPELHDREKVPSKGLTIIQGETYALKGNKDNFESFLRRDLLQDPIKAKQRMKQYPLKFEAFDIVMKNNHLLNNLPLSQRKKILAHTIPKGMKDVKIMRYYRDTINYTKKVKKDPTVEGVVYKNINSPYVFGKSSYWKKLKFRKSADTIVTGYKPGARWTDIGSIRVGVYDKRTNKIREVATVESGLTRQELLDVKKRLDKGQRIYARIGYQNLGGLGRLRAPTFEGYRTDITLKQTHI